MKIQTGSTDVSVTIRIVDSADGTPENAVEHNTVGIDLWYRREVTPGSTPLAKVAITEVALASLATAHTDGGIELIGDGYYRLDLPDAAVASGAIGVTVGGTITDMVVIGNSIELVNYDPQSGDRTVAGYASGQEPLKPTVAGNTLDVTATGAAGVDLGNVENETTTLNLSGTTVGTVTANTDMRGTDNALLAASTPANFSTLGINNNRVDANVTGINNNGGAASKLATSADTMREGIVEAGTITSTQITTNLNETETDVFVGRVLIFKNGNAIRRATTIEAYLPIEGNSSLLTFAAIPTLPTPGNGFIIV